MSQSGKTRQGQSWEAVQVGTMDATHRGRRSPATIRPRQSNELSEAGFIDLRMSLESENARLRARVVTLVLELQSLRYKDQR
jgi:hypothetical protein